MLNHKITFCDKTVKCIAGEEFLGDRGSPGQFPNTVPDRSLHDRQWIDKGSLRRGGATVPPLTVHRELTYHHAQRFGSLTDEW